MKLLEIQTEKWGSNLARQSSIGKNQNLDPSLVTDNDCLLRRFEHRCGVISLTQVLHYNGKTLITLFLDGHVTSTIFPEQMEIRVDPQITATNNGNIVADIWFHGEGKRFGPLESYFIDRAVVYITDYNQLSIKVSEEKPESEQPEGGRK